jgi:hypothetical protein
LIVCFFIIKDKEGALRRRQAETRFCGWIDFNLKKGNLFYASMPAGIFICGANEANASGLSYATFPKPTTQNTVNTGLAHLKRCANHVVLLNATENIYNK